MFPSQSWDDLVRRRRARAERSEISLTTIRPVRTRRSIPDSEMDAFDCGPSCDLDFGILTESNFEGVPELEGADPPHTSPTRPRATRYYSPWHWKGWRLGRISLRGQ